LKNAVTFLQTLFSLSMYFLGALLLAGALFVPIHLFSLLWQVWQPGSLIARSAFLATGLGFGYFIFGFTLCAETVVIRFVLGLKLKEGEYNFFSPQGIQWAFVNAMVLIIRITFMDFLMLTPFLPLYLRLMGAKIGKRVQINTKDIADASLLEIGDDSVIGGNATLIGHLAEHGKLKLKKTVIGQKVTIGLGSVIMPGAVIGNHSLIAARSVLAKNSIVPEKSLYAGTPAKLIKTLEA
jgi:acetyltransferase-like isoleucine patch superfamily enzyme